jgi:hypothetical protein
MNYELFGRNSRGLIVLLSWNFPGRAEENHEQSQSEDVRISAKEKLDADNVIEV